MGAEDGFGNYARKMFAFEGMDFAFHLGGCVGRFHRHGSLEYDAAFVAGIADKVNGVAGFSLAAATTDS